MSFPISFFTRKFEVGAKGFSGTADSVRRAFLELHSVGGIPYIIIWTTVVLVFFLVIVVTVLNKSTAILSDMLPYAAVTLIILAIIVLIDHYIQMWVRHKMYRLQQEKIAKYSQDIVANYVHGKQLEMVQAQALANFIVNFEIDMIKASASAGHFLGGKADKSNQARTKD
jgi:hypothetical protein